MKNTETVTKTEFAAFADRVNPARHNFSPKMTAIIGAILGFDYGVRDGRGGRLTSISITSDGFVVAGSTASDGGGAFIGDAADMTRNIDLWLDKLNAEDKAEFKRLYSANVADWRSVGRA